MAGLTTVAATNFCDATGEKIASATIYFQPCSNQGVPLSFRVGSSGQVIARPVSATVTAGVFTITLADTTLTSPINVGYLVTAIDNLSGQQLLGPGYIIQPSGSSWSFDTFVPDVAALALIQTGPQGQGLSNRGAWTALTQYRAYDFYLAPNGSTYLVSVEYFSGSSYGSVDTNNTQVLAAGGALSGTLETELVAPYGASISGSTSTTTLGVGTQGEFADVVPYGETSGTPVAAEVDGAGNVSAWTDEVGTKHFEAGVVVEGGVTMDSATIVQTTLGSQGLIKDLLPYGETSSTPVYAETDLVGNVSAWTDTTGRKIFEADVVFNGPVTMESSTDSSLQIQDTNFQSAPTYGVAKAPQMAVVDNTGAVAQYVDDVGNLQINLDTYFNGLTDSQSLNVGGFATLVTGEFTLGVDGSHIGPLGVRGFYLASGELIFAASYMGRANVYALTGSTLKQLTFLGTNVPITANSSNQILFATNRNGSLELWTMNADGSGQTILQSAPKNTPGMFGFFIIGQSLAEGHDASDLDSRSNPYAWMFNGGIHVNCDQTAAIPIANITSLVPLKEEFLPAGDIGTTMATSFSFQVSRLLASLGQPTLPIMAMVSAQNGAPYRIMAQGTQVYSNGLQMLAQALELSKDTPFILDVILAAHGEADDSQKNANYAANLLTWQQNYQADIQALTGQSQVIPLIITQISNYCSWATTPTTPQQVDAAAQANPGVIVNAGPSYIMEYQIEDKIHMLTTGYNMRAEYYAKAWRKVKETGDFHPLRAIGYVREGTTIVGTFQVPVAPLVIDTQAVSPPEFVPGSLNGFEYSDGSSTPPAIVSMSVTAPDQVTFVLSAVPTGSAETMASAWTATEGVLPGPFSGPRCCLRDSDPFPSSYDFNLFNWLIHQKLTVTVSA